MLLLLLLASTAFVSVAPFGIEHSVYPGPSFDRILERIVTEEAEKINRTADEHAAYCTVRLSWQLRFLISQEEELALRMETAFFVPDEEIRFNSTDEVLPYFAEKTPRMFSAYRKFGEYLSKKMHELNVGQETVDFMSTIERAILESALSASNTPRDLTAEQHDDIAEQLGKNLIGTVIGSYKALSEDGKNDVEKMWCLRTVYRVIEATGKAGEIKEFVKERSPARDKLTSFSILFAIKLHLYYIHNRIFGLPWQLRFLISQEEELALRTEIAFFAPENLRKHPIHYEDEVLPYFREKTPHMYSAYMKFRVYLEKKMYQLNVGQERVDFMRTISINSGVKILSYSFSETQQGKSGADRDISKGGRKMRSHRDKQHNVITPEDMFDALNATLQLRATSVFLAELVENSVSSTKIKKITELSYFEYHGSDAKDLHTNATLDIKKQGGKLATAAVNIEDRKRILASFDKNPGQYEEPTFWLLPHEVAPMLDIEPNARDDDIVTPNRPDPSNPAGAAKQSLFYCRDCGSSFILYRNLLKHIEKGKHFIRPEHVKLLDRVLGLFMRAIEDTLAPEPLSPVSEVVKAFKRASDPELPQGWAIKHGRKVGRYSEATKAFVKAKFDEYAKRGAKLKADEAERLMRADRFIEPKDWMTKSQLRNYINSLKSQLPKMRAWRRQVEHEDMDDEHFEVEVEPSDEDIVITEEDFHRHLTPTMLKKFFSDVDKPATSGYKALREEGRNDIEKMWCVRTAFRVIEASLYIGMVDEYLKYVYASNQ
ncbi:hypothetical protein PRIPAC_93788 [Pristionchus pacificus]|uniref:NAD(P)H-hydrate epimerase n=1 Tax=Pristionchus pacificus TaxID=54126 RepID=A0A2A6BQY2_PRIPA|nr:hypothetical protein PRIPAC_93788 [Pristionchus pacificus]|eukprot:PDM68362.1 hypothetical protein PRIPAC_46406 [Pristionchus pacificus]